MNAEEEARFRRWWTELSPGLVRTVRRIAGTAASDVVQDVAVLVLRNWSRFGRYEDFARWCHIRAKWLALDELARLRRRETVLSADAEPATVGRDVWQELTPYIEALPDRQRAVVMDKLAGHSTSDTAARMGITESAVRSHWRFAQQNLARRFGEES